MKSISNWLIVFQALGNVAIFCTFVVYSLQLKVMRKQLVAAQQASQIQNLFTIIEYLQRPEFRDARARLFSLRPDNYASWTDEERLSAERVCSGYDAVSILIRGNQAAAEIIVRNWGYSISKCFENARPLIEEVRSSRDANTWDDFEWLAKDVDNFTGIRQRPTDS